MDITRRMRWHVQATYAPILLLSVLTATIAPVRSSALFETLLNKNGNVNCLPNLAPALLQQVTMETRSSLSNIMDHLMPNILIERVSGTRGNLLVREFIKSEMNRLDWLVEEDIFRERTPYGVVTFTNIVATLNPAATKRLVIACHYDSKYLPGNVPFVAASDSAVPCSVMMDLGRQLSRIERLQPSNNLGDITPQLIFFDGEEAFVRWTTSDSLYGSRHLANLWEHTSDPNDPSAVNNLVNINFFVLMDLIGTSDTRFVNYYSNTSHYFGELVSIEQCLRDNNLMTRKYPVAIFDPFGRAQMVEDDHSPFIRRGVPVLHLISTPFPRVWHTVYDNLLSLDLGLIDDFSRIFSIFLVSVLYGV